MAAEQPYCRLTVLAPRSSVDVALPADVPVAELTPMVLELIGEPAPGSGGGAWRPQPWLLTGAAGGPLPLAATLGELGVLDGELLRIAPRAAPPPAPVFDDPVDALAATAGGSRGSGRRFGSAAVLVTAIAAAGLLAWPGAPASPVAAALAAAGAVLAVVHAARLARRPVEPTVGEHTAAAARTSALVAVALAAAAGWAALAGPPEAALLLAVAAAGTTAAVAQVVLRVVAPSLVGVVVAAVLGAGAAVATRFGIGAVTAAAAMAAVAIVAGPLLPRAALRLAGLPRPVVPADAGELMDADDGPDLLPPEELAERADLARGYLCGLAGGCAVAAGAGALVAAAGGGVAGSLFAGVTAAVLGLRARSFADPDAARVQLASAIATGIGLAAAVVVTAGPAARPLVAAALLLLVAGGIAALARARPIASPVARRAVDLFEGLLVIALVPLAFWAMDLFRIVRGL